MLNAVPLTLLLVDVRATLAHLSSRRTLFGLGALSLGGGLLLPLYLLAVAGRPPLMLGAALCVVLGGLLSRFVIIALPRA